MAYTDDSVKAKLSALNETQESIVTVAQWIMFHRRHGDRTASLWLQKLKDSGASKRLNLIYLANEVVQQSKARKKDDFLIAFSPIIAEATACAYKGATNEVQQKVRRVVEVWRQRQIFELPIQEAVETRINDIDKTRSTGKKSLLGGGAFSSSSNASLPVELQPLLPLQTALTKAATAVANTNTSAIAADHAKLMDESSSSAATAPPSAPVHAARLSALLKALASAEGAVSQSVRARHDLIAGLERLLGTHRDALTEEEARRAELDAQRSAVEAKKRAVEDEILRKLPSESPVPGGGEGGGGGGGGGNGLVGGDGGQDGGLDGMDGPGGEPERPQVEELTPPPVEQLTPVGSPSNGEMLGTGGATPPYPYQQSPFESMASPQGSRAYSRSPLESGVSKKRKMESTYGGFAAGDAVGDLDEDVAELLRAEGGES